MRVSHPIRDVRLISSDSLIYSFRDLAWSDDQMALVLVAMPGKQLELHALPISSFDQTSLKPLANFSAMSERSFEQILYVPRGSA